MSESLPPRLERRKLPFPMRHERKGKISPLSAEVTSVLREIGKKERGIHPEIWARWSDIVGIELANRAIPRSLVRSTLTIAVANSAWLQELSYLKRRLIEQIEQEIGSDVVKEIHFVVDVSLARRKEGSAVRL
jgi:hypothetical protein